jgi:hypothetical protein
LLGGACRQMNLVDDGVNTLRKIAKRQKLCLPNGLGNVCPGD